jgi:signal transduction histidine kinase
VETLRVAHERVLAAGLQQERLIEALLILARSERGLEQRKPFDLMDVVSNVLLTRRAEARHRGLQLEATLTGALVWGDPRLAERLVANLVDNALRHNVASGRIDVTTASRGRDAVLTVVNTGPDVLPVDVARLFEPFQRAAGDRITQTDGSGLGLSIVRAIATAHDATVTAQARPVGGLTIEVAFRVPSQFE